MGQARGLAHASHPGPTLAVTILLACLAALSGRSEWGVALVAGTVLTGQLAIGWCNDLIDRDRDAAVGRTDKPLATGAVSPGVVRTATAVALVSCVPLSLANGWVAGSAHLAAVAWGLAYDAGLKATVWSAVPYAASFGLQIAFVSYGGPGGGPPSASVVIATMLLAVGAHLTNAAPDLDDDAATGVRGLPHRLGARASLGGAAAAFVLSVGLIALDDPAGASPGSLALVGSAFVLASFVAVSALRLDGTRQPSRWVFRCAIAVGAIGVALLVVRGGVR